MEMEWREKVDRAKRVGEFTGIDKSKAAAWACCKVGEEATKYPSVVVLRNGKPEDGPVDTILDRLGMDFMHAVDYDRFAEAEHLIDQIEDRVLELKREAGSGQGDRL